MIRVYPKKSLYAAICLIAICTVAPATDYETLASQVEIRRTDYGVPHIIAENERALGFGFAWCQAEDHIESIMKLILAAKGELAKTFGGLDNAEQDFEVRQYRVYDRAQSTFHKLDPDFRELTIGFAAGLSYYIETHRDELPDWVQPVGPHDVAAHGLTGIMRFAFDRGGIVRRLKANLSKGKESAAVNSDWRDMETGSNMWALGPKHTRSGNTILMGNPHQAWSMVATYYEAHLTLPGKLNFYGSTFIGRPVLTTGFNERLGWSHTVNYPDLEEIYEIALDPEQEDHYLFDGGSIPLEQDDVVVEMKTDDGMIGLKRTFWHTPMGPVVHRTRNKIYVLRTAAWEEFRAYQQWLRLAQSQNFDQFRAALDIRAIPMFNICYADKGGNIYYIWNGTIPRLPHEAHLDEPVAASGSNDMWTDFHTIAELPQLLNPKGDYVQNCNSPFHFTNLNQVLPASKYPSYFRPPAASLRTQQSLIMVHNDRWFSLEDVRDEKFNMSMMIADRLKDDLVSALDAAGNEFAEAAALLKAWNNKLDADSKGSVLFKYWLKAMGASGYDMNPGVFKVEWSESDPIGTPQGLADPAKAVEKMRDAIKTVKEKFGKIDVTWGEVHRVRKGDVDLPVGGGEGEYGTFRVLAFSEDDDGKQVVRGGDSWIFTVEFEKNGPRAYTVVGYSQSGDPNSPHYADQAELFTQNKMKPVAFTEAAISENLESKYRPGKK